MFAWINGTIIECTLTQNELATQKQEYAEYLKMQSELPPPTPSLEERVAQAESNVASLQSEMDDIGYIFTGKEHE